MKQYLDLLNRILSEGVQKGDRTGTGTISVFGHQMRFNLEDGFPLLTTKKLHLKSIIYELLWFLDGNTNATGFRNVGYASGTNGPILTAVWATFMVISGVHGLIMREVS